MENLEKMTVKDVCYIFFIMISGILFIGVCYGFYDEVLRGDFDSVDLYALIVGTIFFGFVFILSTSKYVKYKSNYNIPKTKIPRAKKPNKNKTPKKKRKKPQAKFIEGESQICPKCSRVADIYAKLCPECFEDLDPEGNLDKISNI
jgi:hypothetical protein